MKDIITLKNKGKHFSNVKLTAKDYVCNMSVCKAEDAEDTWFIANNLDKNIAIREYKKRFDIEEMFKDFKGGEFNLEHTWSTDIQYVKMLYFCVSIAYCYIATLGVSCTKDKKNNLLGVTKIIKGKKLEFIVYSELELNDLNYLILHAEKNIISNFRLYFMNLKPLFYIDINTVIFYIFMN